MAFLERGKMQWLLSGGRVILGDLVVDGLPHHRLRELHLVELPVHLHHLVEVAARSAGRLQG